MHNPRYGGHGRRLAGGIAPIVWLIGLPTVILAAIPAMAAPRASYSYTQVEVKTPDGECANLAINSITNNGVMLGTEYCTPDRSSRGFIQIGGHTTVFKAPGSGLDTEPSGISTNAKYVVLSTQRDFSGTVASYLRSGHHYRRVDDPKAGEFGTAAAGVNDHQEIVGFYYLGTTQRRWQAFVERHGRYQSFHIKIRGVANVALIDVTDQGDLAGYYQDQHHRYHGFLVVRGHVHVVNAPGAGKGRDDGTEVDALADNGTYCGDVVQRQGKPTSSTYRGFVHRNGRYAVIRVPRSYGHDTDGNTCNDAGDVAGDYIRNTAPGTWERMAYLATPPSRK